jgi:hypothetical protein
MKPLSKRAATALEALQAGGGFWTGMAPAYSHGMFSGPEIRTVLMDSKNHRIKGVGGAALEELETAGFEFAVTDENLGTVRRLKQAGTP